MIIYYFFPVNLLNIKLVLLYKNIVKPNTTMNLNKLNGAAPTKMYNNIKLLSLIPGIIEHIPTSGAIDPLKYNCK